MDDVENSNTREEDHQALFELASGAIVTATMCAMLDTQLCAPHATSTSYANNLLCLFGQHR